MSQIQEQHSLREASVKLVNFFPLLPAWPSYGMAASSEGAESIEKPADNWIGR